MLEGWLSANSDRWGQKGRIKFTEPLRVTLLPEEPVAPGLARIPAGGGDVFVDALINECLRQGMTIPEPDGVHTGDGRTRGRPGADPSGRWG